MGGEPQEGGTGSDHGPGEQSTPVEGVKPPPGGVVGGVVVENGTLSSTDIVIVALASVPSPS